MLKKILSLSLCSVVMTLNACINQPINQVQQKTESASVEKSGNVYIVDVGRGKLGANFSTKINFAEGFKIKVLTFTPTIIPSVITLFPTLNPPIPAPTPTNTDGVAAKLSGDIAKVDAYLIESATAPSAGSDPISMAVTNGTATGITKTTSTGSFTILFKNVPTNTATKRYYVCLVAKDSTGNVISKNPSTDWTGSSASKGLAITNGGGDGANPGSVNVDSVLKVSSTTGLTVGISLLDATGAQIVTTATVTNGSATLSAITAS